MPTDAPRNVPRAEYTCAVPAEPELQHLGGNVPGGDYRTFTPPVWQFLMGMAAHALRRDQQISVLDLGCGEGDAALWFQRHGCGVLAVDGWSNNVEAASALGVPELEHDLRRGPVPIPPRLRAPRIAWCCEVLEHIDADYADYAVATLCAPGTVVVGITAAPPGQDGHHHVNCQPRAYWDNKFAARGFEPNIQATSYSRILLRDYAQGRSAEYYWIKSGRIYTPRVCA